MSEGPPGGHGTTTVTVELGQPCASALKEITEAAAANASFLPVPKNCRIVPILLLMNWHERTVYPIRPTATRL
jgi:hypothetical protein